MKGCGGVTKRWVDELLDKMTGGDHSKAVSQIRQVQCFLICCFKNVVSGSFVGSLFAFCVKHILYCRKET